MKTLKIAKTAAALTMGFLLTVAAQAQNNKLGSWNVVTFSDQLNSHFSFFAEAQTRSQRLTRDFFYHEEKAGIGYNLANKISFLLAAGNYRTYSFPGNFESVQTREFRLWEQFAFKTNLDPVRIDHRFRIEQRWLNGSYRNRFRYRINPLVPINHKTIIPHTLYASIFEELFFTSQPPYFERNRFFAGLGYQFNKLIAVQSGFIRQFDYHKIDDGSGKNFVQTSILFTINHTAPVVPKHPETMD